MELSQFNFFVDVSVHRIFDRQLLVLALQAAYDEGADGSFEIREQGDKTVVRFERTVADADADYLRTHMLQHKLSPARAAKLQLARELSDGAGPYARDFVQLLFAYDGVIVDPHGALDVLLSAEA